MSRSRNKQTPRRRGPTKQTVLAATQRRPIPSPPYFHGGVPGLGWGDLIRTADNLGWRVSYHDPSYAGRTPYDPKFVYFTTTEAEATSFAARFCDPTLGDQPGYVYEVEPVGVVERDPDFPDRWLRARSARVTRVVAKDVDLSEREQVRLEAPFAEWAPGERRYDDDGYMLPSAQMIGHGVTIADLRIYGPFVHLSHVNAHGGFRVSDDQAQGGPLAVAQAILAETVGLDPPEHQVELLRDQPDGYVCSCGHVGKLADGVAPHVHQLGEALLAVLTRGMAPDAQGVTAVALAWACARRHPSRWHWFDTDQP